MSPRRAVSRLKNVRIPSRSRAAVMDEMIKNALKQNEAARKSPGSVPWKPDQPQAQPYHAYNATKQAWEPVVEPKPPGGAQGITRLALYSWNVDFMLPFPEERMGAALDHLEGLTKDLPSATAAVIFLQECVEEDLATIGGKGWVRDKFYLTDTSVSNWASGLYGTTTLVDRRLDVASCFRVHFARTQMERDAFFVEVSVGGAGGRPKKVRLCNLHLESLALEPPLRPSQIRVAAKYMREDGVDGALAAGDLNAIQPFDRTLHADNGLKDAYLELGGREDSDEGYTWGQQAATKTRNRFGCSRMDKVFFTGCLGLRRFERFGADVQLSDKSQAERLVSLGFEKPWITDHLGVVAEFDVVDSTEKL